MCVRNYALHNEHIIFKVFLHIRVPLSSLGTGKSLTFVYSVKYYLRTIVGVLTLIGSLSTLIEGIFWTAHPYYNSEHLRVFKVKEAHTASCI